MWTVEFWKATAERVLFTFLEAFLAASAVTGVGVGFGDVPWLMAVNVAGVAALVSLVKCVLAALPDGNPSAGSLEYTPARAVEG